MASPKLTPEIQQHIVAFLRAGGFPEVAAEAAGVPRAVFESWLSRGEAEGARPPYRGFAIAVRQAMAQARLGAEVEARNARPLDWLRSGPGRDQPRRPGWSGPAKAGSSGEAGPPTLRHPEIQALLATILEALEPFPEARAAVVRALEK